VVIRKTPEIDDFSVAGVCEREMNKVRILVMVGEYDAGMIRLDRVIRNHGAVTIESLKLEPFWDPVRNNEKFKEIISNPAYQINLQE